MLDARYRDYRFPVPNRVFFPLTISCKLAILGLQGLRGLCTQYKTMYIDRLRYLDRYTAQLHVYLRLSFKKQKYTSLVHAKSRRTSMGPAALSTWCPIVTEKCTAAARKAKCGPAPLLRPGKKKRKTRDLAPIVMTNMIWRICSSSCTELERAP